MAITKIKKLIINKFRSLQNIEIEPANRITVICGKNGTSKSSILGIAAQIFNFETDYVKNKTLKFDSIIGKNYKSQFSDHFRLSKKFDTPGSLDVDVEIFDGYTNSNATCNLGIYLRTINGVKTPRPVVRKNSTAQGIQNDSRNFTHPVIYLSLQRLLPITLRTKYGVTNYSYLSSNIQEFIALNNELLNKSSSNATGTTGSLKSAVAFSNDYDQDSVSAGEDNAGQIILALMSFKKLKSQYADYKGGLLLIDEADAGLFPAAQISLISILDRFAKELNLQVLMTSHSPTIIEHVYELNETYPSQRNYKTIYLSNTFGPVQRMNDYSWSQIYEDLLIKTVATASGALLPKVNVYFEDAEGADFFKHLIAKSKAKPFTKSLTNVSMGCGNYAHLIKNKVPEFADNSLIVLDGDIDDDMKKLSSIVTLPTELPPDQLLFEFLYNLPQDDSFWTNKIGFTYPVFRKAAGEILTTLKITITPIDLRSIVDTHINHKVKKGKKDNEDYKKLRKVFKAFYKHPDMQAALKLVGLSNPWRRWIDTNAVEANTFKLEFEKKLTKTLTKGYGVDSAKLPF